MENHTNSVTKTRDLKSQIFKLRKLVVVLVLVVLVSKTSTKIFYIKYQIQIPHNNVLIQLYLQKTRSLFLKL